MSLEWYFKVVKLFNDFEMIYVYEFKDIWGIWVRFEVFLYVIIVFDLFVNDDYELIIMI